MRKCIRSRRALTVFFLICMIAAVLVGCGRDGSTDSSTRSNAEASLTEKGESTKTGDSTNAARNIEAEDSGDPANDIAGAAGTSADGMTIEDTDNAADVTDQETVFAEEREREEEKNIEDNEDEGANPDTSIIYIENPSWKYYLSDQAVTESLVGYTLDELTKEPNDITDDTDWFIENGLSYPGRSYTIGAYSYDLGEWNDDASLYVSVTHWSTGETFVYVLEDYKWAPDINERYEDFADQRLIYAEVQDGVLYVSSGHNTYADTCEETAYITAIDMETNTVLWKSAPMVCNARSFVIVDDYIVCGYGFTKEDDYLNVLRRDNGVLQEQIPLKTAPYYIFLKDGILYVRCYDTNYTFHMAMG